MARSLKGAKPLPELMLTYDQFDPLEQTLVKLESKCYIFIQENVFENVICKLSTGHFIQVSMSEVLKTNNWNNCNIFITLE